MAGYEKLGQLLLYRLRHEFQFSSVLSTWVSDELANALQTTCTSSVLALSPRVNSMHAWTYVLLEHYHRSYTRVSV